MARNNFFNPANSESYDWPINHDSEQGMGKARSISRTANTGNVGLVKQQSDDGPLIVQLQGSILTEAQYTAFWHWYVVCKNQTIHFTDFAGDSYEVQITSFVPTRKRAAKNPKDASISGHYWSYELTMEVYGILAGSLAGAGVTP